MRSTVRVRHLRVRDQALVAKSGGGSDRARLRREAEVLGCLSDAAVVELVACRDSDERTDLVTAAAGDDLLAWLGGRSPEERWSVLRSTVVAVATLHRAGWSHGALRPDHVLVDPAGRIRLCSLGAARSFDIPAPAVAGDLDALVDLLTDDAAGIDPSWTIAERWRWTHRERRLGRALADAAPTSAEALLDAMDLTERRPHPRCAWYRTSRRVNPVAAVVLALAALVAATPLVRPTAAPRSEVASEPTTRAPAAPSTTAPSSTAPTTTAPGAPTAPPRTAPPRTAPPNGAPEVTVAGVRYRAGRPGDVALLAPVRCSTEPVVLVLRPRTGQVFAIDAAPTAAGSSTEPPGGPELLTVEPGATSLERHDLPCTHAVLRRTDGSTTALATLTSGPSTSDQEPPT